jgi:hypothetical protein
MAGTEGCPCVDPELFKSARTEMALGGGAWKTREELARSAATVVGDNKPSGRRIAGERGRGASG